MRRCVCVLLVCLLLLSVTLPAYADDMTDMTDMTEYELKDLGMTVSLPTACFVMTLDELSRLAPELAEKNKQEGVYLEAWDQRGAITHWNIVVMAQEGVGVDFRSMSDEMLELFVDSYGTATVNTGITASAPEVYESAEIKFVGSRVTMDNDGQTEDAYMYLTANGYHLIYFTIYDNEGSVTDEEETVLKAFIDSVRFTAVPEQGTPTSAPEENAGPLTYEDAETGTVLTLPEDWAEVPFNTPKEFYKAKFAPQGANVNSSIMYGWQELPEELSSEELAIYGGYGGLIKEYLKLLMPDSEPESVTYGDNEYYVISGSGSTFGITYPMQTAICINGKYMFMFNFGGTGENTDKLLKDFESLLASAEFAS